MENGRPMDRSVRHASVRDAVLVTTFVTVLLMWEPPADAAALRFVA